jgi:hypothetical protein
MQHDHVIGIFFPECASSPKMIVLSRIFYFTAKAGNFSPSWRGRRLPTPSASLAHESMSAKPRALRRSLRIAIGTRLALLFWMSRLTVETFARFGHGLSWRDVALTAGGLFPSTRPPPKFTPKSSTAAMMTTPAPERPASSASSGRSSRWTPSFRSKPGQRNRRSPGRPRHAAMAGALNIWRAARAPYRSDRCSPASPPIATWRC